MTTKRQNWKLNSIKADLKKDQAKNLARTTCLRFCSIFHLSRAWVGTRICIQLPASKRIDWHDATFLSWSLRFPGLCSGNRLFLCSKRRFSPKHKKRLSLALSTKYVHNILWFYSALVQTCVTHLIQSKEFFVLWANV